ncbi:MAG: hypothetical protein IPL32_08890 [Chloracidobacterium sp.]|nr:hypothetical protein [Chloracidobacterium sp.]
MRNFLAIVVSIFVFCMSAFSQTSEKIACPSIFVYGPAGIVNTGDIASFTANVGLGGEKYNLKYTWSVSAGDIVSGQGTDSISVRVPERENLTVTVEVDGMPDECEKTSSETQGCGLKTPEAILVDEFRGSIEKVSGDRLVKIVEAAKSQPDAQLYIFLSGSAKNTTRSLRRKMVAIANGLKQLHDRQITYVTLTKNNDIAIVWLVPPGASLPIP